MAALLASLLWPAPPLLLWNASGSSPVGLYSVTAATPRVGEMAVAWAPPAARQIAAARSYLPLRVPLVKRVAAVRGDRVCARGNRLFVNGRFAAVRRSSDPSGRAMPWWSGCVRLGRGDLLLLSADRALAFDGRYFGVTRASDVIGKAELLWAR
jgi:conjugative transfer signal peptidase TraF